MISSGMAVIGRGSVSGFERVSSGLEATGMVIEQVANGLSTGEMAFALTVLGHGA